MRTFTADELKAIIEQHALWHRTSGDQGRRANLSDANLSDANLIDADLSRANLIGADLSGAYLSGAYLSGAYLSGAYLIDANLSDANLSDADLSRANLSRANLSDADLSDADLSRANLSGANLSRANLSDADLSDAKEDLFEILSLAKVEVPFLLAALREGRVDGSTYLGPCCCLVGTLANARGCSYSKLGGIVPDSSRPAERWFLGICQGDTPETSQISAITVQWVEEWLAVNPANAE